MKKWRFCLALGWWLGCITPHLARAEVGIEYIGHACFVVESPDGIRVVIDPYNGNRWLGYDFPGVEARAVLVTHPHYDHDASYYFGDGVPVFREPGEYRVGDVRLLGVEGRHADPYGKDFGQKNTIWLVEAGGVRLVHLGDNGPLTAESVRALGRVDVLMVPADGLDHILKTEEIDAIRKALKPAVTIPMHYRLDGFRNLPESLGPLQPWLEKQSGVLRLDANIARLAARSGQKEEIVVFQPSPALRAWPEPLAQAWMKLDEARRLVSESPEAMAEAAARVREAYETGDGIVFAFQWARALAESGDTDRAMAVLEKGLAAAGRDDWEYRMRAHSLLGELYDRAGRRDSAAAQQRIVLAYSYRLELRERAKAYLDPVTGLARPANGAANPRCGPSSDETILPADS